MSACRVALVAAAILASAPAHAGSGPARVGFANLAPAASGAAAAIDRARAALPAHRLAALAPGAVRDALEAALPPTEGGDTARAPLARARERLAAARRAYASFAYSRALTDLDAVNHALLNREPSPPVTDALVERFLLAGLVASDTGHPGRARAGFRLVHHLDPNRTRLDAGEYRPQVVSLYQDATRASDHGGILRVVTTPTGARVWLDGHLLGPSPRLERDLDPGQHWVVATAVGRAPRGRVIDVNAGKTRTVELALAAHPATQRIAELRRAAAAATSTDELSATAARWRAPPRSIAWSWCARGAASPRPPPTTPPRGSCRAGSRCRRQPCGPSWRPPGPPGTTPRCCRARAGDVT